MSDTSTSDGGPPRASPPNSFGLRASNYCLALTYVLGCALAIWILVRLSKNDAAQQDDYAFAIAGIFVGLSGAFGWFHAFFTRCGASLQSGSAKFLPAHASPSHAHAHPPSPPTHTSPQCPSPSMTFTCTCGTMWTPYSAW